MSENGSSRRGWATSLILILIFLAWGIFSYYKLSPIIKEYPIDSISAFNGSFLSALGILIGFAGLSAFYYFGKFGELSSNIRSEAQTAILSYESTSLEFEKMILKIKKIEKDAVDSGQPKKVINKIHKEKSDAEEQRTKNNEFKNRVVANSENVRELIKQSSETITRLVVVVISLFLISLILSIVLELTKETSFLSISISLVVCGVILMMYEIVVLNDYLSRHNELLSSFQNFTGGSQNMALCSECTIAKLELLLEKTHK